MADIVFITGISSGIGHDTTRVLISKGYKVIGTVRKESDRDKLLNEFPSGLQCLICDIADEQSIESCFNQLDSILEGQKLYALINNAGIAVPGPMHMITDDEFFKQMNVNLIGTRKVTNRIIPYLEKGLSGLQPKIIFISSVSGIFAAPFNGSYCVSKHAVECLVDIYRRELHYLNIDVVSILPGPIKTKIWGKVKGSFDKFKVGVYEKIAERADEMINATEKQALPVENVSMLISDILGRSKNRNRYIVHKKAFLLKLLAYCVPSSVADKMIWKNLDKADSKKYRPV